MRADLRGDRERHITICVRERKTPNQDQKLMRAQICAPSFALCARGKTSVNLLENWPIFKNRYGNDLQPGRRSK